MSLHLGRNCPTPTLIGLLSAVLHRFPDPENLDFHVATRQWSHCGANRPARSCVGFLGIRIVGDGSPFPGPPVICELSSRTRGPQKQFHLQYEKTDQNSYRSGPVNRAGSYPHTTTKSTQRKATAQTLPPPGWLEGTYRLLDVCNPLFR